MPWLTQEDFTRWEQGSHFDSYEKLGAHPNRAGTWFSVWAPYADSVSVIGDFNGWNAAEDRMTKVGTGLSGLWEVYVRGARPGQRYKFRLRRGHYQTDKTDPYAREIEPPMKDGNPLAGLSSVIYSSDHVWGDSDWMASRKGPESMHEPVSMYEVHLGSWMRADDGMSLSYRDIAEPLARHVHRMGFTHVELMPVQEHPYYASWGYQVVGYYAPTFRYGSPDDFRFLVDYLHRQGIGVILDWVPAHFATDPQGLVYFDGSTLFEYDDPVMRKHPDWGTFVFDYAKPGVQNFLISNACYWMDEFHIDGLRFDAVASMLYRDYSRDQWTPNRHGGRENLEAIDFLKKTNEQVFGRFPTAMMIAEESTAWPGVSAPTFNGGLGFLYKWNMGWMHDTLEFMRQDPINRKFHFNSLTFPLVYAYSEHYTLTLSHDEVVHGKGSLWNKMPGDAWQKAANLRLLYGHMWGHPGKKLLFMGQEFGQKREWSHDRELDWFLEKEPLHAGVRDWVIALNDLYKAEPALWNEAGGGFEWIDLSDWQNCIVSYRRKPLHPEDAELVFVLNFTPVVRYGYGVHMPAGEWDLVLNSDNPAYGGSGVGPGGRVESKVPEGSVDAAAAGSKREAGSKGGADSKTSSGKARSADEGAVPAYNTPPPRPYALLTLPPLGVMVFRQVKK